MRVGPVAGFRAGFTAEVSPEMREAMACLRLSEKGKLT
jgi:hypothetical protein